MKVLVNIDVPDLAAATAFYCAALGLRLTRVIEEDVAELAGAASTIYLLQNPPGPCPARAASLIRHYARHWTPVHLDFVVDDVAEAARAAEKAGATRESECIEWMGSKCITFSDPFGHGFCLIEFANQTYEARNP